MKRKKCYTVPHMRTLVTIMSIVAIVPFVLAAKVAAPLPPPSPYADMESVTNVVFSAGVAVSSVISALPAGRRGTPEYIREFGIRLKRYPAYQELVGIVSNNQETICANFGACATNELSRMVLLAAWWGGDDTLYVNGLSNCLDMAMSGVVTRADLDWYRTAHFNVRRGNILALRYDEPGMSNLVSRLYGFTGETNACNRILSGGARISITNYLNEISHNK